VLCNICWTDLIFFFFFAVLGMEPRALHILGTVSITQLYPQPSKMNFEQSWCTAQNQAGQGGWKQCSSASVFSSYLTSDKLLNHT
jgi:hypothetical protein